MKRIAECDKDTLYQILENIGINMKDLAGMSRSTQELVELYSYLLRMQLTAWKAGKNYREVIQETNQTLRDENRMLRSSKRLK